MFAFSNEIHSVRHALTILGERETRRWIRLVALVSAGMLKSTDLVLSALVRARFCELLSPKAPKAESDLFLVGLVSMMDAILEVPMEAVTRENSLDQQTKTVLLGGTGRLRPVYQLMLAQEAGRLVGSDEVGPAGEQPNLRILLVPTIPEPIFARPSFQVVIPAGCRRSTGASRHLCAKPLPLWTCTGC